MESNPLQDAMMKHAMTAEALAYTKYTIYAEIFREAGYASLAMAVETLAKNEKEHMEQWLKKLGILPDVTQGETEDDMKTVYRLLDDILHGEDGDSRILYPELAKATTRDDVKTLSEELAKIEEHHREIIVDICHYIKDGREATEKEPIWVCPHCGNYYYRYDDIPEKCPVCNHDGSEYTLQSY